jgi:glycosyltransferase involved in cell wall biosynthesis
MAGITVIRVGTYITSNEGFLKRTLDYMSFMVSGFIASIFVGSVDIVIGTSPQFFTVCAAYMTGLCKRVPWIFELRDIWPESIRAVGAIKSPFVLGALERVELFLYRKASAIVSVTHAFREMLIRRGVEGSKIHVVTNGVDISRFTPRDKDPELQARHGLQGKFVAGYIGTHGLAHGLDIILDAAKAMSGIVDGGRFRFILLGDGATKAALVRRACVEGLDSVIFIDSVSKDDVARYWSLLDVSIIHLKRSKLFTTVIPSKLFECMGMAIPVLHGVQGESAEIVENEDVGICFEPENTQALCNSLERLADDHELYTRLKRNGPRAALNYDRSELASRMLKIVISQL